MYAPNKQTNKGSASHIATHHRQNERQKN